MDYRRLGSAGVKVSPICLGTAFRGQDDEDVCIRTIERAIDHADHARSAASAHRSISPRVMPVWLRLRGMKQVWQ